MIRRVMLLVFLMATTFLPNAQPTLRIAVPQNVCIQSEQVAYAVMADSSWWDGEIGPILHVQVFDRQGREIQGYQLTAQHVVSQSTIAFQDISVGGSYVLCASVMDEAMENVLEQSCTMLHLLTDKTSTLHRVSEYVEPATTSAHKTRESICVSTAPHTQYAAVVDSELSLPGGELHYRSTITANVQRQLAVRTIPSSGLALPALWNTNSMRLSKINDNDVASDIEIRGGHYQLVDQLSASIINNIEFTTAVPMWSEAQFTDFSIPSTERNRLRNKIEQREIIERIFHPYKTTELPGNSTSAATLPDTDYNLDDYVAFESIELFIREAAPVVSIRNIAGNKELRVLNGDSKKWFDEQPLLLINGVIQTEWDVFWDFTYTDCTRIRLYRTLETMRTSFGPLGRNGVIELLTREVYNQRITTLPGLSSWSPGVIQAIDPFSSHPFMRSLQFFGHVDGNEICFDHGDDLGTFHIIEYAFDGERASAYEVNR